MCKRIEVVLISAALLFGFSGGVARAEKSGKCCEKYDKMMCEKADVEQKVKSWTKKLNLTPEQQAKVREIKAASREEIKAAMEATHARVKEVRAKMHDQISTLLSEEQKAKFEKICQERQGREDKECPMSKK